jgi:hypothetical protein
MNMQITLVYVRWLSPTNFHRRLMCFFANEKYYHLMIHNMAHHDIYSSWVNRWKFKPIV